MSLGKPPLPFFQSLSSPPPPPPPPLTNSQSNSIENKISPSILLITVILAVIFFISGLVHLLVRYLLRPINREPEEIDNVTVLQGQLQQLFHLHDAGVDQSYIDTLPIFLYKAIIGLKDPFDCAVCLCEFEADDKLRLLPKCSHAFHLECIDTWLLSHSTCPLCRSSLLPEFSPSCSSPMLLVLESASESSREPDSERGDVGDDELRTSLSGDAHVNQKQAEIDAKDEVVTVKLGKFRNVETSGVAAIGEGEGCSNVETNRNLDQRRCFSMGSFEYVMDESSLLQVSIKLSKKRPAAIQKPGHRGAMSECDCHSRREEFSKAFDHSSRSFESIQGNAGGGFGSSSSSNNLQKKESFSISKIWLRQKKKSSILSGDFSTRAFSFRLSLVRGVTGDSKMKSNVSEPDELEKSGSSEFGVDVEIGSSNSGAVLKAEEGPSFARRTLLWLGGRQNKVVNHV
ncbi:Zinc finger RING/FYVE/PHD-type protein [Dioscorea alata]|uniref:Zinc finger RING/FYVE/PHD-type protein n=1 Tax=Dioscorea alata TaxID=55571 RepID=A0ACB7WJU3_DIOAL|nr:Zinc finger RING/FYVE/PHD-type protein [Dioscorea alata]